MEFALLFLPFLGCAVICVACFTPMHRGSSSAPPAPDRDEAEAPRSEVVQLRADVADSRRGDAGRRFGGPVSIKHIPCRAGRSSRRIAGSIAIGVVLGLPGCSSAPEPNSGGASGDVPGLSHVHGLGINPADGRLYAASHYGVFRIVDGRAEPTGSLIQDTMGFTVAGPNRFLGSGHPDIRNDTVLKKGDRPLLGLIESTDRAISWRGLSLQGEVDFHALTFAHDRVYGFDSTSGRVMVSTDLKTWESRAQIGLASLAVSPDSPDLLVATAEQGVVRTSDGARTLHPVAGAPALVIVSWDRDAGLWGLATDGRVHSSTDGGATWTAHGNVEGQPAALLAHREALFAATSTAVLKSTDRGTTWTTIYRLK